jgi:hypothetical protein
VGGRDGNAECEVKGARASPASKEKWRWARINHITWWYTHYSEWYSILYSFYGFFIVAV